MRDTAPPEHASTRVDVEKPVRHRRRRRAARAERVSAAPVCESLFEAAALVDTTPHARTPFAPPAEPTVVDLPDAAIRQVRTTVDQPVYATTAVKPRPTAEPPPPPPPPPPPVVVAPPPPAPVVVAPPSAPVVVAPPRPKVAPVPVAKSVPAPAPPDVEPEGTLPPPAPFVTPLPRVPVRGSRPAESESIATLPVLRAADRLLRPEPAPVQTIRALEEEPEVPARTGWRAWRPRRRDVVEEISPPPAAVEPAQQRLALAPAVPAPAAAPPKPEPVATRPPAAPPVPEPVVAPAPVPAPKLEPKLEPKPEPKPVPKPVPKPAPARAAKPARKPPPVREPNPLWRDRVFRGAPDDVQHQPVKWPREGNG